ncbi:peptidase domain-containing ABC transporter [Pedobacter jeongneungensis]|uniref:peptidase domain-containing ABC transporter n=1 Tax=Pedobacter jeongneungensis TaxID=947309 RepID=UPI000469CCB6|nr:peptidase domain-containing ABC transporter [Pedobacter jeongneungensis]
MTKRAFKLYRQLDAMDCGPTCLRMIAKHYGKNFSLQKLREFSGITRDGVSLLGINNAAKKLGFRCSAAKISISSLNDLTLPMIIHWDQNHFVVLYKIKNGFYYVANPAKGLLKYNYNDFLQHWLGDDELEGIILCLEPTETFYQLNSDELDKLNLKYLWGYIRAYKRLIIQLFAGLAFGIVIQLTLPFLMQVIVDIGIKTKDLNFIYIILLAQTMLTIGKVSIDFIRSWILLHISTRINISILTDFFIKLMGLPMSFFDTRMTGDIMQRIDDQKRIESFLTGSTLSVVFSFFNLIVFALILSQYNLKILLIFLASSILYCLWIIFFLKKRRTLDHERFDISAKNQSAIVQLISGMQEIKLNNSEKIKRWEWERIQSKLFKFNVQSLTLGQYQQAGTVLINETKNILITFLVASSVVKGDLTLGAMMAVQYIIGQLNSPIDQILGFVQQFQDARVSYERLNEIKNMAGEDDDQESVAKELGDNKSILLKNLTFSYPGSSARPILSNINLAFPSGKTTAIVGMSGSGKTTLLKLMLRFYEVDAGLIMIGNIPINKISFKYWRDKCGVVMQDGFIFSDTIAGNIAVSEETPDILKLRYAVKIANIGDFIDNLPLGLNTKIGAEGNGISQGQKQRILIARSVYKNPDFIFFDEATNALDANNESIIINNLKDFFKGKTVVVVAHRLSTVKSADNIVVLNNGIVSEQGSHNELVSLRGRYFSLVKNQLELDS